MATRLSFMKHRKLWFTISGLVILAGIISLLVQGLNLGVDFTGGLLLELDFQDPVTAAEVHTVLAEYPRMNNAQVLILGSTSAPIVRIKTQSLLDEGERDALYTSLEELGRFELLTLDPVSPVIGRELTRNGLIALAVALAGMVAYITIRFQFRFAVSAMAALLHDSLVTLGLFSLFQVEVDTAFIAAILTIVGYSVNDTIVVFDRLRENLKYRSRHSDMEALVDSSIHETLRRSLATSLTTFVAVAGLFIFGGESIRNFTLALMLGILVGTYSSLFIASPLWLTWQERKPLKSLSRV